MLIFSVLLAVSEPTACQQFVGSTVSPMTSAQFAIEVSKSPAPKGEFETSADYQQRLAKSGLQREFVVSVPVDRQLIKYDADRQVLGVPIYAINQGVARYGNVQSNGPGPNVLNVDFVLNETSVTYGHYVATNAYGASRNVSKIRRRQLTVYERGGDVFSYGAFQEIEKYVASIPVGIGEAPATKASIKFALVFTPRAPYLATYTDHQSATIDEPEEVDTINQVVPARITCGIFMSASNRVIYAQPAR